MAANTFTQFPTLAKELRTMIWLASAAVQVQDTINNLPRFFFDDRERRRQAFIGHDNLPSRTTRLPLRIRIHDPYNGRRMRIDDNDFETLVDCLPMSAVSREARAHAAEFCRDFAPHMVFEYDTRGLWSLDRPEVGADPVLLKNVHCISGMDTLEHIFARPTTLTMIAQRGLGKSPEYLVDMINRFFGNRVERLILEAEIGSSTPQERAYWHVPNKTNENIQPTFIDNTKHDPCIMFVTDDGKLHLERSQWHHSGYIGNRAAMHLVKSREILDVSREKLPRLKYIDLNLGVQDWARTNWVRIKSSYEDGILSVNVNEINETTH